MKKPSFNKILEAEFEPKKIDLNKIVEDVQHDNFDIDFGEDSWDENGKETTSFEIFHNNETIAYGKIDVNTGEVKVGGSFYSDKLDEAIKDKEFKDIQTLQDILSEEIAKPLSEETSTIEEDTTNPESTDNGTTNTEIPATQETPQDVIEPNVDIQECGDNVGQPTTEPQSARVIEEGLDPVEAVKICKTEEELDSLANEYLMPEEYELYIETKPDADFEDNKNFVLHLLTSGDDYKVRERDNSEKIELTDGQIQHLVKSVIKFHKLVTSQIPGLKQRAPQKWQIEEDIGDNMWLGGNELYAYFKKQNPTQDVNEDGRDVESKLYDNEQLLKDAAQQVGLQYKESSSDDDRGIVTLTYDKNVPES